MKKLFLSIIATCMFLCLSGVSNAALIDQGDGTIYDDVSSMYWYQDLNTFKGQTYNQMLSTIGGLTTGGLSWHMATEDEMDSLIDNVGEQNVYGSVMAPEASQITGTFIHTNILSTTTFYQGIWESVPANGSAYHGVMQIQTRPATESYVNDDIDDYYYISGINQSLLYSFDDRYGSANTGAWVTSGFIDNGSSSPVPVPATMTLFGLGLLGLAGVNRRKN